jgi:citrate lyase beta subunit
MQYFNFLSEMERKEIFLSAPESFSRTSPYNLLRKALGALFYIPANNERIAELVVNKEFLGAVTMSIDLEDSVGEQGRQFCMDNTQKQVAQIKQALDCGQLSQEDMPLFFVRVKDTEMFRELAEFFALNADIICGVVLPKVTSFDLPEYLAILTEVNQAAVQPFYALPIMESEEIIASHDRIALLEQLKTMLDAQWEHILNIRIGATDFCGLFGVRRYVDTPVYSLSNIALCISDITRVFGLHDKYTISAPVWEYYTSPPWFNEALSSKEIQGLLAEVRLDLQNGLMGKTAIHPSQLVPIQAMHTVSFEAYSDAIGIAEADAGARGVLSSKFRNKMNELRPHALWAQKVMEQAHIYGVFRQNTGWREIMELYYRRRHD